MKINDIEIKYFHQLYCQYNKDANYKSMNQITATIIWFILNQLSDLTCIFYLAGDIRQDCTVEEIKLILRSKRQSKSTLVVIIDNYIFTIPLKLLLRTIKDRVLGKLTEVNNSLLPTSNYTLVILENVYENKIINITEKYYKFILC